MLKGLRSVRGVLNSLRVYYGDRRHRAGLDAPVSPFRAGRATSSSTSARMWATASASFAGSARAWSRSSRSRRWSRCCASSTAATEGVAIEPAAVGRAEGFVELMVNRDNPTISTASPDFVAAAAGAKGWEGQRWDERVRVPMTTLDALIARHGVPAFAKIDVEGFEAEALAGLTRADSGAVLRVHHHPARRRACGARPLRRARLFAIQCVARRDAFLRA